MRLAEKWARMHALDFPRVPVVDIKADGGIREVYVIHDYENHRAPVIIHFVLVSHEGIDTLFSNSNSVNVGAKTVLKTNVDHGV